MTSVTKEQKQTKIGKIEEVLKNISQNKILVWVEGSFVDLFGNFKSLLKVLMV